MAMVALLARPASSDANMTPTWSPADLTNFADLIVTGRVATQTSGWDPAVGAIYTYVTVDVDEVLKGFVAERRITIKQLGGVADELGLTVPTQAHFTSGEPVLLFLEARPRDRTLYTSALWQGKWSLDRQPTGDHVARRAGDQWLLQSVRAAADRLEAPSVFDLNTAPVDASASQTFTLMSTPYRFSFVPPVDVQAGGQPGLPGGGVAEIRAATDQWNAAGSSFRFAHGVENGRPRCTSQFVGSYRVTISFLDPCGEISNTGGTLAIGGSYFSTTSGATVDGRFFRFALEGFVINNDSAVALQFLRQTGCFHNIQLHELGHVLGLGHSTDTTAIMFPSISTSCANGPSGLAADDLQGIRFIYPNALATAPGPPTITRVTSAASAITVDWQPGAGPPPTGHRLDFLFFGTTQVQSVVTGGASNATIPIPPGIQGTFTVQVSAFVTGVPGPPSSPFTFTIGETPHCTASPASPHVSGFVLNDTAAVSWPPVPGATGYILQAGTTPGGADLVPATNLGLATGASASGVPAGFTAWVRVTAIDACGSMAAQTDFFLH